MRTKQIVFNLSKQHTDKKKWEAAELAPRRVAARRGLQHRAGAEVLGVRRPTRIGGPEELRVVAQVTSMSYGSVSRASGVSGPSTRQRRKTLSSDQYRCFWKSHRMEPA